MQESKGQPGEGEGERGQREPPIPSNGQHKRRRQIISDARRKTASEAQFLNRVDKWPAKGHDIYKHSETYIPTRRSPLQRQALGPLPGTGPLIHKSTMIDRKDAQGDGPSACQLDTHLSAG